MAHGMEVSTENSKIITNSMSNISADISMNGQKLEEPTSFKYLGATLCKNGTCSVEVRIRIASAMAAMVKLNRIWRSNTISFVSKVKMTKCLVTSILLYGCEAWTLLAHSDKRIQDFETKSLMKLLRISYLEHKTSDWLRSKINSCVPLEPLLAPVKRQKLAWFGHVTHHNSLSKTILRGTLMSGQPNGQQRKCWIDNIKADIPAHAN